MKENKRVGAEISVLLRLRCWIVLPFRGNSIPWRREFSDIENWFGARLVRGRSDRQSDANGGTCCAAFELQLADTFDLAVALVDIHASIHLMSPTARDLIISHPALVTSERRLGLISNSQSSEFRIALRYVLSGQPSQTLRADDGCMGTPLTLQITRWRCASHCLVSLQSLAPRQVDLSPLKAPFDLSKRQLQLLEMFTAGLSLADIATELGLRPQTVRETFCDLYSRFELRNQLELLSALKSLSLTRF